MYCLRKTVLLFFFFPVFIGCTAGTLTKMKSTAPSFGPVLIGMSRGEVERNFGPPILEIQDDDVQYTHLYEYEIERGVREIILTDVLDILTFGLGEFIISPLDRLSPRKHLALIGYSIRDRDRENDRVIYFMDKFSGNPYAIVWSKRSYKSILKSEWEKAIKEASAAVSLEPRLSSPYIFRSWAYREIGLYDRAIRDCDQALDIDSKNALALSNRGLAYERKGETQKAIEDYEKACKMGLDMACENLNKVSKGK